MSLKRAGLVRGALLRSLREQAGETQVEACRVVGVTEAAFRRWEQGGPIGRSNLASLAKHYGVAPSHLIQTHDGVLPPLGKEEYRALKEVIEKIDALESIQEIPLRHREQEEYRDLDLLRAQMRAAVDGYEATHGDDTGEI